MEDFNINSKIIIFCLIICLLIPLSTVNASDINNTAADNQVLSATPSVDTLSASVNLEQENDTLSVQENDILSAGISGNDNILKEGETTNYGTYKELDQLIKLSTDSVILLKNYKYNPDTDSRYINGINITKSFNIDGNNKIIHGSNVASCFNVIADNVNISNLNIVNTSVSQDSSGAITWHGDYGKIDHVNIINSSLPTLKVSQSAGIYWLGEYGLISNTNFINNTAVNSGVESMSAIGAAGNGLRIEYSSFINNDGGRVLLTTESSSNTYLYNCTFMYNDATSYGVIFQRRGSITIDKTRFINNTGTAEGLISFRAPDTIKNSYFSGNNATNILFGYFTIDGCTFEYNKATGYASNFLYGGSLFALRANSVFKNSHVCYNTGEKKDNYRFAIYVLGDGVEITNTNFDSNNNSGILNPGYSGCIVENCNFTNINTSFNGIILFEGTANASIINNCKFEDTTSNIAAIYNIGNSGYGYANIDDNPSNFVNTLNSTGDYAPIMTNSSLTFDDSYIDIFVNETGGGDGKSGNTTLEKALTLLTKRGTIHLANGNYTYDSDMYLKGSMIGDGDNVNLSTKTIIMSNPYTSFKNINVIRFNSFKLTNNHNISNCNFTTPAGSNFFNIVNTEDWSCFKNSSFINCTISNSVINSLFGRQAMNITFENMTIINTTFNSKVFDNFYVSNIKNVTFDNITTRKTSGGNLYPIFTGLYYDDIYDITIKNSNLNSKFNYYYNTLATSYSFNGVNIINCNYTDGTSSFYCYNGKSTFTNINFINVNITNKLNNIFFAEQSTVNIENIYLYNFSNIRSFIDIVNCDVAFDYVYLENGTIDNVFFRDVPSVINELHVNNVSFTEGVLVNLSNNMILKNSIFENYTGHVVVSGDNAEIVNCNFIKGNNSDLNGSSIIITTGSDMVKIINCEFTSNNASNGTIYIENECKRPAITNSTFTDNRAEFYGGAMYVVSPSPVTLSLDSKTNQSICYPSKEGYEGPGYNDFIGNLSDIYEVLYLINDTNGKIGDQADGKTRSTPSSDLSLLYQLMDGASVYFVHYGDTFTPASPDLLYPYKNYGVTFYGNGTTLVDMGIEISNDSNNLKVYNITFKDYPGTVLTINGTGCVFDNCSFINVGGFSAFYGGAMQINANDTIIKNSKFINCTAAHENTEEIGDSLGGALYINASNIIVENCHFEGNNVSSLGSHIYICENQDNVTLKGNNFTTAGIVGTGVGSGVIVQGSNMHIYDNNFTDNNAYSGGAMRIIGDTYLLNLKGNNFSDNTVTHDGGALYLSFINSIGGFNYIVYNNFTDNVADNGGALYIDTITLSGLIMNNNNYTFNNATNGGAFYINCPGFELADVTIKNNTAVNGGAVYVNADDVTIRSVDFIGNNATLGGALYVNASNTNVIDSKFFNNTANESTSMGSAVYVSKTGGVTLTNVELNDNYVYDEVRSQRGDIFVDGGKFADDGITYGTRPYQQYLSFETIVLTVAYVSQNGGGKGTAPNNPTTLDDALSVIDKSNSIIYLVGDDDLTITNNDALNNLDNVTIVNYNDGKNRKIQGTDKYLFINLK